MKLLNKRFFCFIKCYDVIPIQLLRRKTVITDIIFYDYAVFGDNFNLTLMFIYKYKCADGASQCITPTLRSVVLLFGKDLQKLLIIGIKKA